MKYLGKITDNKDLVTKEYVDNSIPVTSNFMVKGIDYVTAGKKSGTTLGTNATAEGYNTTASGSQSHAEGNGTTASGVNSHAEGYLSQATGNASHAENRETIASGTNSHAEGFNTTASGDDSHAEGYRSQSIGKYSHAEGFQTNANRRSQHVFGEWNIIDTTGADTNTKGDYVEIVGNGSASTRNNARTLDWNGNEVLAGKLTVGTAPTNDMDVATKKFVDDSISAIDADKTYRGGISSSTNLNSLANGIWDFATTNADFPNNTDTFYGYLIQYNTNYKTQLLVAGKASVCDVYYRRYLQASSSWTAWKKVASESDLSDYMKKGVDYVTAGQLSGTTLGTNATAEGYRTTASGDYSHTEGVLTTASGDYSHAEGDNTVAYYASHAEGSQTQAEGSYSHAEGEKSAAFGTASHAENFSSAYGLYSHSEGHAGTDLTSPTQSMRGAVGDYSHSEGLGTTANRKSQHVFGEYNIVDTFGESSTARGKYVEIVGNGSDATSTVTLSNARTLDWSGNETLAGNITIGNSATMQYNSTDKSIDFVFI